MTRWGLAVLCAAVLCNPALAHFDGRFQPCDNRPPDSARQPVSVPVSIFVVPGAEMFEKCRKQPNGLIIYGCTFLPSPGHSAVVLLNADQNETERACTLAYEEAHLPPNNWLDAAMEAATPDARPLGKSAGASDLAIDGWLGGLPRAVKVLGLWQEVAAKGQPPGDGGKETGH